MLRKLYKYEFLSLFRTVLPIYAAVLGFAVINRLCFLINTLDSDVFDTIQGFSMIAYIISIIAVFAVGFIVVIIRFYKNLLTEEGYLTFTLPINTGHHIVCKLLCGIAVVITNFIAVAASLLILGAGTEALKLFFSQIKFMLEYYVGQYGVGNIILIVALVLIMALVTLSQVLLMLYASMSVGQRFKNKILGSAIAYICFYFAMEIILLIALIPIISNYASEFENWLESSIAGVQTLLGCLIAMYLILGAVYWLITRYFLTKKLNLE